MEKLSAVLASHGSEFRSAVRDHKYDVTDSGLMFPAQKISIGGVFGVSVNDGEFEFAKNRVVDDSINYIIDLILHGATQIPTWYIAQFSGNVTPAANLTALTFPSVCTEFTGYQETTRQEYIEAAAMNLSTSNADNLASFTITTAATIYGAAILSVSTKSATSGRLLAAARYTTSKVVDNGDILKAQYTFGATST